jgi:uncharacterized protein (TIGR02996 family)
MDDATAFIRRICEEPDEDTHRLVFADWLDDHDESERAEFIRLHCLGRLSAAKGRIRLVRKAIGGAIRILWPGGRGGLVASGWKSPLLTVRTDQNNVYSGGRIGEYVFGEVVPRPKLVLARGFVERVICAAVDWTANADSLVKTHPVREVTLTTVPPVEIAFDQREPTKMCRLVGQSAVRGRFANHEAYETVALSLLGQRFRGIKFTLSLDMSSHI